MNRLKQFKFFSYNFEKRHITAYMEYNGPYEYYAVNILTYDELRYFLRNINAKRVAKEITKQINLNK